MKSTYLLFFVLSTLSLQNCLSGEPHQLALVNKNNAHKFLRPLPSTHHDIKKTTTDPLTDDTVLERANGILNLAYQTMNAQELRPKEPSIKDITRAGLIGAGVTAGTRYFSSGTRGISDLSTLVPLLMGAAAATATLYGMVGREMGLIMSFKPTLDKIAIAHAEQAQEIAALKEKNNELASKVDETLTVTAQLKEAMPAVVAASGDNATLAGIIQDVIIPELKEQKVLIASLLARLPEEERAAALNDLQNKGIIIEDNDYRKAEALKSYNWLRIRHRTHNFSKIPGEWLQQHGYGDLERK